MSFILLIILLIALFIYWYKHNGIFYFKTDHVEISITPAWIRETLKNYKEGKGSTGKRCKNCGSVIGSEEFLCGKCDEKFNNNYISTSGSRSGSKPVISEDTKSLKQKKYNPTKLKEAVKKGGSNRE